MGKRLICLAVAVMPELAAAETGVVAGDKPIEIAAGVAQLFIDDYLIDTQRDLKRTLRQPKKDNGGNTPLVLLGEKGGTGRGTLMANGTIVYDLRLKRYVMFAKTWPGRRISRLTSSDALVWIKGDNGQPEEIPIDLMDAATGRSATNADMFSCYYDLKDAQYPYRGWLHFANWGDDLEGVFFMRSRDGKKWERGPQVVNGYAGRSDPSCREIKQKGRTLRGPGDVTQFYYDPVGDRFLGIFKFYSPTAVPPGNRLRSRAYVFLEKLDQPFDTKRIDHVELLPRAAEANGDQPYDEYYASTAWRYESLWLGGLKIWHSKGDYPYSVAGCAFLKLVVSRDGLHWKKVPFPCESGLPEVFIPNGPEGGNDGLNDGGYMTEFSQGPLRIGDELIYYYGCSSYGKNHKTPTRISGGGIFRARLRADGFVSVDGGTLLTRPMRFAGRDLFANAVGPVAVEALDARGKSLGEVNVGGDSLRHRVTFAGKSLSQIEPDGVVRLRFTVRQPGRLYSFAVR